MLKTMDLPVPHFILDQKNNIISQSSEASKFFSPTENFLDLVDLESITKVKQAIINHETASCIEVNLITKDDTIQLFDLYLNQQEDGLINVVAISKHTHYNNVQLQIRQLREQIEMTNFNHVTFISNVNDFIETQKGSSQTLQKESKLAPIEFKINNIEELLRILRPDFIELHKSEYIDILLDELDKIRLLL